MFPNFSYIETRPEETLATGSVASSIIPTQGHAALAHDHYRISAYVNSNMS